VPSKGQRREGSSSMPLFQGKERKGQCPFQKGKGAHRRLLVLTQRGDRRMQWRDSVRWWLIAGVGWHLD
jgi:hypothetical protein